MSQPPAPTAAEHDGKIDNVIEKMAAVRAASGSGSGPANPEKKQWTYDEFQKVLDETPLFMRETPKDTKDNYVLEALKSLVFEGDGDGECPGPVMEATHQPLPSFIRGND